MSTITSGVFLGQPKKRIYQKVNATPDEPVHYDFGTMFFTAAAVKGNNNTSNITAVTTPLAASEYIGIVSAVEGATTDGDGYITLHGEAKIDVKAYLTLKAELEATNTMNLPSFYYSDSVGNTVLQGVGQLELVNVHSYDTE